METLSNQVFSNKQTETNSPHIKENKDKTNNTLNTNSEKTPSTEKKRKGNNNANAIDKNAQMILYHKLHSNKLYSDKNQEEDNSFAIPINEIDQFSKSEPKRIFSGISMNNNPELNHYSNNISMFSGNNAVNHSDISSKNNVNNNNFENIKNNESPLARINNYNNNNINISINNNISQLSNLSNISNLKEIGNYSNNADLNKMNNFSSLISKNNIGDVGNMNNNQNYYSHNHDTNENYSDQTNNISPRFQFDSNNNFSNFNKLNNNFLVRQESKEDSSKILKISSGNKKLITNQLDYEKRIYENFTEVILNNSSTIEITNRELYDKEILFVNVNKEMKYQLTLTRDMFNYYKKKVDFNNLSKFITELNDCFIKNCENELIEIDNKCATNRFIFTIVIIIFSILMIFMFSYTLGFSHVRNTEKLVSCVSILQMSLISFLIFHRMKNKCINEKELFALSVKNNFYFEEIINKWTRNYFSKFRIQVIFPLGFKYFALCFNKQIEYVYDN